MEKSNFEYIFFPGRFQPLHRGHLNNLKHFIEKNNFYNKKIIFFVFNPRKEGNNNYNNPLNFKEQLEIYISYKKEYSEIYKNSIMLLLGENIKDSIKRLIDIKNGHYFPLAKERGFVIYTNDNHKYFFYKSLGFNVMKGEIIDGIRASTIKGDLLNNYYKKVIDNTNEECFYILYKKKREGVLKKGSKITKYF